jgi:putative transposase
VKTGIRLGDEMKAINVNSLCKAVQMTRANWYKQRKHRARRKVDDGLILALVMEQRRMQPRLGGRKLRRLIEPGLADAAVAIGRDRFFGVLRANQMLVPKLPKSCRTTNSRHSLKPYPNLIKDFEPTAPNQVWVSDITYLRTDASFVYLALEMDLYSRKIVGYDCSDSLEAIGCINALNMGVSDLPASRRPIHHSDRGCQYCCHEYVNLLNDNGFCISMTEVNHCAENSNAERLNGILKQEYGLGAHFKNKKQAQLAVEQAIWLYNYRRPHMSLNMGIPAEVHARVA